MKVVLKSRERPEEARLSWKISWKLQASMGSSWNMDQTLPSTARRLQTTNSTSRYYRFGRRIAKGHPGRMWAPNKMNKINSAERCFRTQAFDIL